VLQRRVAEISVIVNVLYYYDYMVNIGSRVVTHDFGKGEVVGARNVASNIFIYVVLLDMPFIDKIGAQRAVVVSEKEFVVLNNFVVN